MKVQIFRIYSYIPMLAHLFDYKIMERAVAAAIIPLLLFIFFGGKIIELLRNWGLGQKVYHLAPKSHFSKEGTPTAGGVFIYIFSLIAVLLFGDLRNNYLLSSLFTFSVFTFLGFLDDVLKKKSKKRGLTISQKFFAQIFLSCICIFVAELLFDLKTPVRLPFLNISVDFNYVLYILFCIFIITGTSNAVNLTDGLDGLAGGHLAIAFAVSGLFIYFSGHSVFAKYFELFFTPGVGEITVLIFAILGALLGFLWWNNFPAQIFMGDSGSLSLGALLGFISILGKFEFFLPILGFLFVIEALSVIIQVAYFKITGGKRIFRMAPLHHHFELGGMSEPKVVARFIIVAIIFGAIAIFGIKPR